MVEELNYCLDVNVPLKEFQLVDGQRLHLY